MFYELGQAAALEKVGLAVPKPLRGLMDRFRQQGDAMSWARTNPQDRVGFLDLLRGTPARKDLAKNMERSMAAAKERVRTGAKKGPFDISPGEVASDARSFQGILEEGIQGARQRTRDIALGVGGTAALGSLAL